MYKDGSQYHGISSGRMETPAPSSERSFNYLPFSQPSPNEVCEIPPSRSTELVHISNKLLSDYLDYYQATILYGKCATEIMQLLNENDPLYGGTTGNVPRDEHEQLIVNLCKLLTKKADALTRGGFVQYQDVRHTDPSVDIPHCKLPDSYSDIDYISEQELVERFLVVDMIDHLQHTIPNFEETGLNGYMKGNIDTLRRRLDSAEWYTPEGYEKLKSAANKAHDKSDRYLGIETSLDRREYVKANSFSIIATMMGRKIVQQTTHLSTRPGLSSAPITHMTAAA